MGSLRGAGLAALCCALAACTSTTEHTGASDDASPSVAVQAQFELRSPSVETGDVIPAEHMASAFDGQCTGDNAPLVLEWDGAPHDTRAFAITMTDSDAGAFVHWLVTDIDGSLTALDDEAAGVSGSNDAGSLGYFGPCPPAGDHHYVLTVYALDEPLGLEQGFTYDEFTMAAIRHTLAQAEIVAVASAPEG